MTTPALCVVKVHVDVLMEHVLVYVVLSLSNFFYTHTHTHTTQDASNFCALKSAGCVCDDDRWSEAKQGIAVLNTQLNTSMNFNVTSSTNKVQTGLITWSAVSATNQNDYLIVNAPLSSGIDTTNTIAGTINLPTGSTHWGTLFFLLFFFFSLSLSLSRHVKPYSNICVGTGLCACYKQMQSLGASDAKKICFLMADGVLTGDGVLGESTCSDDGNRGASGACPCDYLWNDVSNLGWTSPTNLQTSETKFVEEFMKSQNITISSVLVGATVDGERIFEAASCDGIAWDSNTGAPATPCPNYLKLSNFGELQSHAQDIADNQRSLATSTETVTDSVTETETVTSTDTEIVSGSVSVCSLDFLYVMFTLCFRSQFQALTLSPSLSLFLSLLSLTHL